MPFGSGERAGTRTPNLVIKSHLLYQLSYAPMTGPYRGHASVMADARCQSQA